MAVSRRQSAAGQDAADLWFGAVGRLGDDGPPVLGQRVKGAGEFGGTLLDLRHVLGDQGGDMPARGQSAVADAEDDADLREGEPGGLGLPDEGQSPGRCCWVVAVAARGARRCREQPGLLVEPDRLCGQTRGGAQVTPSPPVPETGTGADREVMA